jgi:hypothetical protein
MGPFIAYQIMKQAKINIEMGQDKYRAYFVNTSLYLDWKGEVDTILSTEGYGQVIVSE